MEKKSKEVHTLYYSWLRVFQIHLGNTRYEDLKDEDNLGKSNIIGNRNIVKDGDEKRIFGLSTIRNDLKP